MVLKIVATEAVPEAAHRAFAELGPIALADERHPDALARAELLIVRTRVVDAGLLDQANHVRVIARTGVGLDTIDVREASRRGIPVLYAPDAGTLPIAEGTLALILATMKRLTALSVVVKDGRWSDRYTCDVRDIAGSTLGIIGLGRIGSEVARLALCIGMKVVAHDPWLTSRPKDGPVSSVPLIGLDQLLEESDVLSLHCALTDASRGMINAELLSRLKPGAVLINASRGALIADDDALVEALEQGQLSAVGLDVFTAEPPDPSGRLLQDTRVVTTPHAIGLTRLWNERVFASLAADVAALLRGAAPRFVANPEIITLAAPPGTGT